MLRPIILVLVGLTLVVRPGADAQTPPADTTKLQDFRDPGGRYSFSYPAKDWRPVPIGGTALVMFAHKNNEATVEVSRETLKIALAPDEVTAVFADTEKTLLVERRPQAAQVTVALRKLPTGPAAVVDFHQNGASGPERVRQYSLPRGQELYRVVCTTPVRHFAKYDGLFERIAGSLRLAAATAAAPR